jgi:hypothetical protein
VGSGVGDDVAGGAAGGAGDSQDCGPIDPELTVVSLPVCSIWRVVQLGRTPGEKSGAGEGNRTLVISLGSWSNAIIRHPL